MLHDDAYVGKGCPILQLLLCSSPLMPDINSDAFNRDVSRWKCGMKGRVGKIEFVHAWASPIRPSFASLAETICQLSVADLARGLAPATHGEYTQLPGKSSGSSILWLFAGVFMEFYSSVASLFFVFVPYRFG